MAEFVPTYKQDKQPDNTISPELSKAKALLELEVSTIEEAIKIKHDYMDKSASLEIDRVTLAKDREILGHDKQAVEVMNNATKHLLGTILLIKENLKKYDDLSIEATQIKTKAETQLAELDNTILIRHQKLCGECQTRDKRKCDKCYTKIFCDTVKKKDFDKWLVKYKRERGE